MTSFIDPPDTLSTLEEYYSYSIYLKLSVLYPVNNVNNFKTAMVCLKTGLGKSDAPVHDTHQYFEDNS